MRKRDYSRKIWADFNEEKKLILVSGSQQAGKAFNLGLSAETTK
jgi:hypothetical protein